MGTWSASILGNDTSAETYERFFELYDAGRPLPQIVKTIEKEMHDSLTLAEDRNNVEFPLALALWECQALDAARLNRIARLVASGRDLDVWAGLAAGAALLKKRGAALKAFLKRISTRKASPRKRKAPARPLETPFRAGCCFAVKSRGRHYAFWVATATMGRKDGDLGVACLGIDQVGLPTLAQCRHAYVLGAETAGTDYPRGAWRGRKELLFYYAPDAPSFYAMLDQHCTIIGYTAPLESWRMPWDANGSALDFTDSRSLVRKLLQFRSKGRRERWRRGHRLRELVTDPGRLPGE